MVESALFSGPPVCIVGNINRDVKVQNVPAAPALFEDGETSVPPIVETIGGGAANSACAAAVLGASVRFVGKVGSDALGQRLEHAMQGHGVQTHLARDPNATTGTTVALGLANGHRHFLSCLPNNETLRFEDLDLRALDGCAHLLRADVWFSRSMLEGGNARLFSEAKRRGIATSLDLNFDPCWSSGNKTEIVRRKQLLRESLGAVDLAHGNVRELCEFTDSPDLETALKRLAEWGVNAVVVHLGARGAGYWADGKLAIEPPSPARTTLNTTGTGDVLSTCMILLHARSDLSAQEKLRYSNQVVREFIEGSRTLIPVI
ncbi:MAG: carbohydrate kinase family protein [Limisphaerales bacterium]